MWHVWSQGVPLVHHRQRNCTCMNVPFFLLIVNIMIHSALRIVKEGRTLKAYVYLFPSIWPFWVLAVQRSFLTVCDSLGVMADLCFPHAVWWVHVTSGNNNNAAALLSEWERSDSQVSDYGWEVQGRGWGSRRVGRFSFVARLQVHTYIKKQL